MLKKGYSNLNKYKDERSNVQSEGDCLESCNENSART